MYFQIIPLHCINGDNFNNKFKLEQWENLYKII